LDSSGSAYVTGITISPDFPTTAGAFDTTLAGAFDTYVTKIDPSGASLAYSTFLGGADSDLGSDIVVDGEGDAHVTGYTFSADFPVTLGAYDASSSGDDAFVSKLSSSGSDLSASTFLGGAGSEVANGIGLDPSGVVYVTGLTSSTDFPTTAGAHDTTFNGGAFDAFVVKLDLAGLPPSTPDCVTSNRGRIIARNGDLATLRGRAETSAAGQPSGSELYSDRGPVDHVVVRSTSIDALVCADRDAAIFGRTRLNGHEVGFRIDLHDGGAGRNDTYRIVLDSGYDSGPQPLRSGNLFVR
jgi:hypothetical protein